MTAILQKKLDENNIMTLFYEKLNEETNLQLL